MGTGCTRWGVRAARCTRVARVASGEQGATGGEHG
jgi:hypothetical protein